MNHSPYHETVTAATYDRLALPSKFSAPATDLVEMLQLSAGDLILDVGSGTGAASIPAAATVGPGGLVIALDASTEMLRLLKKKQICQVVLGKVPGLPFGDGLFQAVLGNFVVSHFKSYELGLADMIRVLSPGGKLGVTTWAAGEEQYGQAWNEVTTAFLDADRLQTVFQEVIPWEEWFSQKGNLQQALEGVGLTQVEVSQRRYRIMMNVTDYLSIKENTVEGTFLRRTLEAGKWEQFRQEVSELFQSRFGESVEYNGDVYFGIGVKPGG